MSGRTTRDHAALRPLVDARGLTVAFGRTTVLAGVDLALAPGDEVALVGRSGSGKSTLLLALAGLLPVRGSLAWPGLPPDAAARRAFIGMVFQAPSLMDELTAQQNVALPLRLRGGSRDASYRAAAEALAAVGLSDAGAALPHELSGGQQQRVAIARVVAAAPRLVLADEPTGALDAATARVVLGVLRERVRDAGGALLLATHDEAAAGLPTARALTDGQLLTGGGGMAA